MKPEQVRLKVFNAALGPYHQLGFRVEPSVDGIHVAVRLHGQGLACYPADIPVVGLRKFCVTTLSRLARAGEYFMEQVTPTQFRVARR